MNIIGPDRCSSCGQHVTHLIRFEHGRPVCLACVYLAVDMLEGQDKDHETRKVLAQMQAPYDR
jgi:hypothetical protein